MNSSDAIGPNAALPKSNFAVCVDLEAAKSPRLVSGELDIVDENRNLILSILYDLPHKPAFAAETVVKPLLDHRMLNLSLPKARVSNLDLPLQFFDAVFAHPLASLTVGVVDADAFGKCVSLSARYRRVIVWMAGAFALSLLGSLSLIFRVSEGPECRPVHEADPISAIDALSPAPSFVTLWTVRAHSGCAEEKLPKDADAHWVASIRFALEGSRFGHFALASNMRSSTPAWPANSSRSGMRDPKNASTSGKS